MSTDTDRDREGETERVCVCVCVVRRETVRDCVCWCKERYCGFLFVCLFTCVDWAWLEALMLSKCLCAKCLFVVVFLSHHCRGQTWEAARDGMREARGAAMCSTEAEK